MSICPQTSVPCGDSVVLDVERLGVGQASGSHRLLLGDSTQPSMNLDQLSPPHAEATPRSPADISIAVTSTTSQMWGGGSAAAHWCVSVFAGRGHFFNRNSTSPRSILCEMELSDIQASLELYEDKS